MDLMWDSIILYHNFTLPDSADRHSKRWSSVKVSAFLSKGVAAGLI